MEMAKILESLIREKGYSLKSFASKCGIPYTTLYGIIKNGVGKASVNNIIVICRNLGIKIEELEEMAGKSIPQEEPPAYEQMELLIARNGKKLSPEERIHLIKLLSENEK